MAKGYAHAMAGHQVHPRPQRPRAPKPKKAMCRHCGQEVTPAHGSPMHQAQVMPPQMPPAMAAMQQQGAAPDMGGPPPDMGGGLG